MPLCSRCAVGAPGCGWFLYCAWGSRLLKQEPTVGTPTVFAAASPWLRQRGTHAITSGATIRQVTLFVRAARNRLLLVAMQKSAPIAIPQRELVVPFPLPADSWNVPGHTFRNASGQPRQQRGWLSILKSCELDTVLAAFAPWDGPLISKASFLLAWAENPPFRALCNRLEAKMLPLFGSPFLSVFFLVRNLLLTSRFPRPCHCLSLADNMEGIRLAFLTVGHAALTEQDVATACRTRRDFPATLQRIKADVSQVFGWCGGDRDHLNRETFKYVCYHHARLFRARQMVVKQGHQADFPEQF